MFLPVGGDFISFAIVALIAVGLGFHRSTALGGLAVVGSSALGAWWWKRLARRRLVVAERGIEVRTLGDAVIDGLVISIVRAAARGIRRRPRRYVTHLAVHGPGASIVIKDYKDAMSAEARILSSIHERGAVDTAPFEIRPEGLVHRGELLRFAELERVIVDDEFAVRMAGKRSMWASCALGAVHDPWLLIKLLLERGVVVELRVDPPATIKASIEAAIAQHANLPRPEVHAASTERRS